MSAFKTKYKVVFLGNESVGKTSIITRFMYDHFDQTYQATIGIDFLSKTMHVDDASFRLQLWDTAGQERFRSLIPSYIRDAAVAIVVYDVSERASFAGVQKWVAEVREERAEEVIVVLVGNKCDLGCQRAVSKSEGREKAFELGTLFMETSAKSGENVKRLFDEVAQKLPSLNSHSDHDHDHNDDSHCVTKTVQLGGLDSTTKDHAGIGCCSATNWGRAVSQKQTLF